MGIRWRIAILLILLSSAIFAASDFSGKVVGISDGDTITVMHAGRAGCPTRRGGPWDTWYGPSRL